jgi:hypothetical protein
MRLITIGTVAVLAALLVSGAAFAARAASSLDLVVLGPEQITTATASDPTSGATQGGQITFDVKTTQTTRAFVNVRCSQDGNFVYDGWHGFFDGYFTDPIYTLASDYWTAGGADCTARLVDGNSGRLRTLATLDFHVDG